MRVTKITSGIGVSWTYSIPFCFWLIFNSVKCFYFFNCCLAAPQLTLPLSREQLHSLDVNHCILHIPPEGQQELCSEVGSLKPGWAPSGVWTRNFSIQMAILSKKFKPDNFELHKSLKHTNIWGLCLNFVECESFHESNSPDILAVWETNLDDSSDWQFLCGWLSSFNPKGLC